MMLPRVACALCGQELQARWNTGATREDRYIAVEVHHCTTQDVRVVDAEDLSDDELLAAVKARGLVVG
jgi:transcription elongation factor Elf1